MKYFLFLLIAAAVGYQFYFNPHQKDAAEDAVATTDGSEIATEATEAEFQAKAKPTEDVRMVQIHGKWYKYRSDNSYLIDGIPTLFIPQVRAEKLAAKTPVRVHSDSAIRSAKSRQLLEAAEKNPLKVYSPDGFRNLKEGVEAVEHSHYHRAQAIEEAAKD